MSRLLSVASGGRRWLSLAELNGELALGWRDLLQLVLALVSDDAFEPGRFVFMGLGTGRGGPLFPHRLEALVEEVSILVVLVRLLRDLGQGIGLRDGDQLPEARGERLVQSGWEGATTGRAGGTLTQKSRRRCAPVSRAGDAAPLDLAGTHCAPRWQRRSLAGTGHPASASCLTAARER